MLISVQAGNSDNKLTQWQWSYFVRQLNDILAAYQTARHFFGGSETYAKWQNVCWVCEVKAEEIESLKQALRDCRESYQQDSVCLLVGQAEFV